MVASRLGERLGSVEWRLECIALAVLIQLLLESDRIPVDTIGTLLLQRELSATARVLESFVASPHSAQLSENRCDTCCQWWNHRSESEEERGRQTFRDDWVGDNGVVDSY